MHITTEQLYARIASLEHVFSYKRISSIDLAKIPTLARQIYMSLDYRSKMSYILSKYADLASHISSGILNLHVVDAYFLGEYIRTGAFPANSTFENFNKFKEASKFYSASEINKQIELLIKTSEENNTIIAKFTKTAKSLFELRDDQTNILYDMLIAGDINIIVYAHLLKLKQITIDFSKIKDIKVYRANKIAEYLAKFNIVELLKI